MKRTDGIDAHRLEADAPRIDTHRLEADAPRIDAHRLEIDAPLFEIHRVIIRYFLVFALRFMLCYDQREKTGEPNMSDLLLRNVDDHLLQHLKAQAAVQGTSVEDYAKTLLTLKITPSSPKDNPARERQLKEFIRKADALAEEIGPVPSDSADDIRFLRDSR